MHKAIYELKRAICREENNIEIKNIKQEENNQITQNLETKN